jgi:hypothetical protein
MHGEKINAYRILVGKQEKKRPLGRPICRREGNIKTDLREIVWGSMDWIYLAQRPVEGSCEHGNEPLGSINFGKFVSSCPTPWS